MREMSICSTYPTYCGHMGVPNHRDTSVVADLFPHANVPGRNISASEFVFCPEHWRGRANALVSQRICSARGFVSGGIYSLAYLFL